MLCQLTNSWSWNCLRALILLEVWNTSTRPSRRSWRKQLLRQQYTLLLSPPPLERPQDVKCVVVLLASLISLDLI